MSVPLRKRALRKEILERILALDPADRQRQESALHALVPQLPGYAQARVVLLYVSAFAEEIDTRPLIDSALADGRTVVCPRVDRGLRALRLFQVLDPARDLEPGTRGIPEPALHCRECSPAEIEWALVPGLAFDEQGFRLGRGAGHYDRLLPTLPASTPRWALALDPQCVAALPVEPHDQPLDGIATALQVTIIRDRLI